MRVLIVTAFSLLLFNEAFGQLARIGVLGSSSANGQGVPTDSGWAIRVKKYYMQEGVIDTLHRVAASTMSIYHGMPTGYNPPPNRPSPNISYNITRLLSRVPKPTHVIINYPSNGYDSFSTAEILFCFDTLKAICEAQGVECYIATTQPREDHAHFFTYEKRLILKNLADTIMKRYGAYAIDFWTNITDPVTLKRRSDCALPVDLIHLSSNGHYVLSQQVFSKKIFHDTLRWTGAVSDDWEDPMNWDHGLLPDERSFIIIDTSAIFPPVLRRNARVRGLRAEQGATITVYGELTIDQRAF